MEFSKYFSFVISNTLNFRKKPVKKDEKPNSSLRFHEESKIMRRPSITEQVEIFRQNLIKKSTEDKS
ncbi:MAG: hypothetical protein KA116_02410 [Proteobacteria bacterium]|nr:hypothetical protein [Pseudomonadota bacterium]